MVKNITFTRKKSKKVEIFSEKATFFGERKYQTARKSECFSEKRKG